MKAKADGATHLEKELGVSQEVLQEILDYLQTRPYNEVYQLIGKLLKEVNDNE